METDFYRIDPEHYEEATDFSYELDFGEPNERPDDIRDRPPLDQPPER